MLSWHSGRLLGRLIPTIISRMNAKARLVARGSGQQLGVDFFNTFAPTPTVSSTKVALAITV